MLDIEDIEDKLADHNFGQSTIRIDKKCHLFVMCFIHPCQDPLELYILNIFHIG